MPRPSASRPQGRASFCRALGSERSKAALALAALALGGLSLALHFGVFSRKAPTKDQLSQDELAIRAESDILARETLEKARKNPNITTGTN